MICCTFVAHAWTPSAPSFCGFCDAEAVRHAQITHYQLSHGASSLGPSKLSNISVCLLMAAPVVEMHASAPSGFMSSVVPGTGASAQARRHT